MEMSARARAQDERLLEEQGLLKKVDPDDPWRVVIEAEERETARREWMEANGIEEEETGGSGVEVDVEAGNEPGNEVGDGVESGQLTQRSFVPETVYGMDSAGNTHGPASSTQFYTPEFGEIGGEEDGIEDYEPDFGGIPDDDYAAMRHS